MTETQDEKPQENSSKMSFSGHCWLSGLILTATVVIAYFINESVNNPEWNWANCLGDAVATGVLTLVSASALVGFLMLPEIVQSKEWRARFHVFVASLSIPLVIAGALWLWRTGVVSSAAAEDARDRSRVVAQFQKNEEAREAADPIISAVRLEKESDLKRWLRDLEGAVEVDGWSAAALGGTKWLVKFQYHHNDEGRWMLYEYDQYLDEVKSVFSDERLKELYVDEEDGSSGFNEKTQRKLGGWYGPIR